MIEFILGNESAEKVLLHIFHYGEIHCAAIAKDYNSAVTPLKLQLERFENGGLLKQNLLAKIDLQFQSLNIIEDKTFRNF